MKANERTGLSNRLMATLMDDSLAVKRPWWRRIWKRGAAVPKIVNRSKYTSHQGDREKARRLKLTSGNNHV